MLTAMDIHDKEFKKCFRGYNPNDVDGFLDEVVNDYDQLSKENAQLKDDLAAARREIEQYHNLEKTLQDTLVVAQKTADEVTGHAKKSAENLLEQTKQECAFIRRQTELDTKRKIEEATAREREITAEYDDLVREKNNFLSKIRILLESELAMINEKVAARKREIAAEYDDLVRERNNFLGKIRVLLESELAVINETFKSIPQTESEEKKKDIVPAKSVVEIEPAPPQLEKTAVYKAEELTEVPHKDAEDTKVYNVEGNRVAVDGQGEA